VGGGRNRDAASFSALRSASCRPIGSRHGTPARPVLFALLLAWAGKLTRESRPLPILAASLFPSVLFPSPSCVPVSVPPGGKGSRCLPEFTPVLPTGHYHPAPCDDRSNHCRSGTPSSRLGQCLCPAHAPRVPPACRIAESRDVMTGLVRRRGAPRAGSGNFHGKFIRQVGSNDS
jgi:hypothetical protein